MTLVEKATDAIRQMIVEKQYDEDGYLPCEGDLCELLSVSRATIREAVRSLEVRGLVQRIHGKGVKVVDNAADTLTQTLSDLLSIGSCTVGDLIEVRGVIETAAARLAADRAKPEQLSRMSEMVARMENARTMDERYIQADLGFHLALAQAAQNPVLYAIIEAYTPLLTDTIRAASQGTESIERSEHYHRDVLAAILQKDGKAAERAMRRHLIATEGNARESGRLN